MKRKDAGAFLLLLAAVIWGFSFSAQVKAAECGLESFTFNGIRFLIGGCALLPVVLLLERKRELHRLAKGTLLPAMAAGALLFIASSLQQFGIAEVQSAGKASFITGMYIVLVPLFSLLFFRRKVTGTVWIGAAFAVFGLYLLGVTPGERIAIGDLYVFAGSFFWAAHILLLDCFVEKSNPLLFAMLQFLTCGLLGIGFACCFEEIRWVGIYAAKWELLYAGILSSGIAYTCQVLGQRKCDPTVASLILSTESVFGALGGLLINGERLSPRAWIGCAFMLFGILLSQLPGRSSGSR